MPRARFLPNFTRRLSPTILATLPIRGSNHHLTELHKTDNALFTQTLAHFCIDQGCWMFDTWLNMSRDIMQQEVDGNRLPLITASLSGPWNHAHISPREPALVTLSFFLCNLEELHYGHREHGGLLLHDADSGGESWPPLSLCVSFFHSSFPLGVLFPTRLTEAMSMDAASGTAASLWCQLLAVTLTTCHTQAWVF